MLVSSKNVSVSDNIADHDSVLMETSDTLFGQQLVEWFESQSQQLARKCRLLEQKAVNLEAKNIEDAHKLQLQYLRKLSDNKLSPPYILNRICAAHYFPVLIILRLMFLVLLLLRFKCHLLL